MPLPMYSKDNASAKPKIKNILAIAAGKGGVGKSTVAVHLALALKNLGQKVGLMDTDVYGPSIRRMLPEDRMPLKKGDRYIPALCQGIQMISMAYFRDEKQASAVRAPIANGIVSQFINNVDWGELDTLIIDFPPGTGDIQLTLGQQANLSGALMVTTPQEIALMDVRKAMDLFNQVSIPIFGVVENMSGCAVGPENTMFYPFGKGGGERLARESAIPFLGAIPIDPEISSRLDQGKTAFDDPQTSSRNSFINIAKKMMSLLSTKDCGEPIKNIVSLTPQTYQIEWLDGEISQFKLSKLQSLCPCAGCTDEMTGKRLTTAQAVAQDVSAKRILPVGRYGLRIEFTSGCSTGIYPFDMVKELK